MTIRNEEAQRAGSNAIAPARVICRGEHISKCWMPRTHAGPCESELERELRWAREALKHLLKSNHGFDPNECPACADAEEVAR